MVYGAGMEDRRESFPSMQSYLSLEDILLSCPQQSWLPAEKIFWGRRKVAFWSVTADTSGSTLVSPPAYLWGHLTLSVWRVCVSLWRIFHPVCKGATWTKATGLGDLKPIWALGYLSFAFFFCFTMASVCGKDLVSFGFASEYIVIIWLNMRSAPWISSDRP